MVSDKPIQEQLKVTVIMLNAIWHPFERFSNGRPKPILSGQPFSCPVDMAISLIESGKANYTGDLQELKRIHRSKLTNAKPGYDFLSCLQNHNPIMATVIQSCQAVKGFAITFWKVMGALSLLLGIYQAGISFEWWPNLLIKPKPIASKLNQTSPGSLYSSRPYSYSGSRTHSHNPEDTSLKRGDRYPKSHVSK